ncbi:MAG: RtcB family protein [Planctomycetes bacterium]|nr:RtcB family protein [Planctomycetota bacterium]
MTTPSPSYVLLEPAGGVPVKAWVRGVPLEDEARAQLENVARLPFVGPWVAVMPDVHWGIGATVGSVIPTRGAIVPAAVGVDIGCGMMAVRTDLAASHLPDDLHPVRTAIERAVPHGRTDGGGPGDRGAWRHLPPATVRAWTALQARFDAVTERHPRLRKGNTANHLGTLGTGNHFIEVCLDEADRVWFLLHSGSRGVGNRIGTYFIEQARASLEARDARLPDRDLAWLEEGSPLFHDYVEAVSWAQDFAAENRRLMMASVVEAVRAVDGMAPFSAELEAVNCHHNYVRRERHGGEDLLVTRKGAVRAGRGELGIIPGSMGARSFIVRGKGNPDSFESCSHGAGRAMSRNAAKRRYSVADHVAATAHVECRKDADVVDETPMAYKDIDAVMAAQADLVEVVHTLRQVVCVKG